MTGKEKYSWFIENYKEYLKSVSYFHYSWKYRRFNVYDKSKFEQVLVPSISIFDLSIISPISHYQIRFSDKLIKYIDQTTDQIQQNFLISKSKSLGYF